MVYTVFGSCLISARCSSKANGNYGLEKRIMQEAYGECFRPPPLLKE
jgi:hypothetical protein